MQPVTWIHTADLHLDEPIRGWKGSKEDLWKRREEYRETFKRIISLVQERDVPFLFIAGDFLEYGYVSKSTVQFVQEEFKKIPETHIFIAPGNHDPYRPESVYCLDSWPEHVHIFGGEWESFSFPEYDLHIYGKGFTDFSEKEWRPLHEVHPTGRKVMVVHGDYAPVEGKSSYFPISRDDLSSLDMDVVALGHIHKATHERLNNQKKTWVCYPGSPEALNWKETGERTVIFGRIDEEGTRLESIPIHTRAYEKCVVDVKRCETREELLASILKEISLLSQNGYITVQLVGRISQELTIDSSTLSWLEEQCMREGFYAVYLESEARPDFDLDYYRQQSGVVGTFIRKIETKMKEEPQYQAELELALYKGLEAILTKEK